MSPPKNTTVDVTDSARAAFQNEGAELFSSLGLNDGGFQANADRVFMLDDTGSLVPAPPYDSEKDKDMTAAAQDGRLYIMDKERRLRQVRLESNANDEFAFMVTNPLSREQQPRRSFAYRIRYMQSVVRDMSQSWQRLTGTETDMARLKNRWKNVMATWKDTWKMFKQDMAKFRDDMKEDWDNIKKGKFSLWDRMKKDWAYFSGRRNREAEPEKVKAENKPLVSEEETLQTEQTVSTPEVKDPTVEQIQQPDQPDMTTEQLLATNPTQLTNEQFLTYLEALDHRGQGAQISDVMKNEETTAANYYEALAQGMEGQVARQIKTYADGQTDPEAKEKFLDGQKPMMASISLGLRAFVKDNSNQAIVNEYFEARDKGVSPDIMKKMEKAVLGDCKNVLSTGLQGYLDSVTKKNAAMQQTKLKQNQPQVQQKQVQQNEVSKSKAPSVGGKGR